MTLKIVNQPGWRFAGGFHSEYSENKMNKKDRKKKEKKKEKEKEEKEETITITTTTTRNASSSINMFNILHGSGKLLLQIRILAFRLVFFVGMCVCSLCEKKEMCVFHDSFFSSFNTDRSIEIKK